MPESRRKYSKTQPLRYEELADCLAWWKNREECPRAWKIHGLDLIKRDDQGRVVAVNLDIKNPNATEAVDHRAPEAIIQSVIQKEREVLVILDEIKALLDDAQL